MPALAASATASRTGAGASASPSATQSGIKFSSKRPHFRDACLRRFSGLAHSNAVEAARRRVRVAWRTPTNASASGPRIGGWRRPRVVYTRGLSARLEVQCCHQLAVKLHELYAIVFAAEVDCVLYQRVEGTCTNTHGPRVQRAAVVYGRLHCENYLAACKALAFETRTASTATIGVANGNRAPAPRRRRAGDDTTPYS